MTSELDFIAALDSEPGNHWLRQLYADWLEDQGDERGPGMRALGVRGVRPVKSLVSRRWVFGRDDNDSQSEPGWGWRDCLLPVKWFEKLTGGEIEESWWWWFDERRAAAEDAAALAYFRLTDAERAKIEAGVKV